MWKEIGYSKFAFKPTIMDLQKIKDYCNLNQNRLIVSACDIDYFERNIDSLVRYQRSGCVIPYVVFVLCDDPSSEDILRARIKSLKNKYNINMPLVELFSCEGISRLKLELDRDSYHEYQINYIRCARFVLVSEVWNAMRFNEDEYTLSEKSAYIIDYDNYILADFNGEVKKAYGGKKAFFCWKGEGAARDDFPESLSCFLLDKNNQYFLNLPHKCIKAGFTALSPCSYSRLFLSLFNSYAIGAEIDRSLTNHRLFSFYYGDQLSMLTALREIRENLRAVYEKSTGWINCSTSAIINLSQKPGVMIWYPKGNNRQINQA